MTETFHRVWRLLTFRLTRAEYEALTWRDFSVAIFCTWVVGVGRWWDDANASLAQHTGVGSIVYICALGLVLHLVMWPINPPARSLRRTITVIGFTAPPAILYAIPVERFMPVAAAAQVNLWFLLAVATWRVALLFLIMKRLSGLSWFETVVGALLPLTTIVFGLSAFNLTSGAIQIMSGMREQNAEDAVNQLIFSLAILSYLLFPLVVIAYVVAIVLAIRRRRAASLANDS